MKSLFRSIRMKLLNEGKLVRYLTYALGEILLIVVGIMLALQLNNWNEDRKAQVEFDEYIVQLKEDVQIAIKDVDNSVLLLKTFQEQILFIPIFLEQMEYNSEDLTQFENGLNTLGSYSETTVHVGLLGELLDGDKEIIRRDPTLTDKALKMESRVEKLLSSLDHIYNQMDLDTSRMNQFRGRGRTNPDLGVPPKYDLEVLKTSPEFSYTAHSMGNRIGGMIMFSENILNDLESFLTVLEEYE